MSATWKTARVFISSTFRDMHAERDHLVTVVFPELRERVEQLGLEFFDVDLRWGVPAKDANGETANSWEYYRQWIDRVEPFFVCVLGQRYGWVPAVKDFKSGADQARQALEPRSITDLEVRHAVLDSRRKRRSYFYLRETPMPDLPLDATAEQRHICDEFVDLPERLNQLKALKTEIQQCGRSVRGYACRWTGKEFSDLDKADKKFGPMVLEDLWSGVLRDERYVGKEVWRSALGADPDTDPRYTDESQPVPRELWEKIIALARPAPVSPLDAERQQMDAFAASRLRWFQGRTCELRQLTDFLHTTTPDAPRFAVVTAVPGQGKSALLAKLSTLVPQSSTYLITHFVGATERSASAHALIERLLSELDRSGIVWPAEEQKGGQEPRREFNSQCLRLAQRLGDYAGERRIVILLDALNQLSDGHDLQWLPTQLGPSVRVIVSCIEDAVVKTASSEQRVLHSLAMRQPAPLRVPLGPLTKDDVRTIVVAYLKEYCHELDREHLDILCAITQSRNPLYLLVMLNELRTLSGNDLNRIVPALIASMPHDHPDTVSLFRWVLQRLEVFGPEAVRWWCLYLAHGRVGMASHELADLLTRKFGADAAATALRIERGLRRYLQRRGPQLDFFHGQLHQAVLEQYGPQTEAAKVHSEIATYFRNLADPAGNDSWAGQYTRSWSELAFHMLNAGRTAELRETLMNYLWIRGRLLWTDVLSLIDDYDLLNPGRNEPHGLVQGALRLSAHVLSHDRRELPTQLTARLLDLQQTGLEQLLRQVRQDKPDPWLRPLTSSLTAPGGPLLRTLEGHGGSVRAVAVSPDGRQAISGAFDKTLRVWNLEGGECPRTLERHGGAVFAVAIAPDGRLAISASGDKTLKLWDPESGSYLRTLTGHCGSVRSVAVTPDGRRAISGSDDRTLKVWELESGEIVETFTAETGIWACVAGQDGVIVAGDSLGRVHFLRPENLDILAGPRVRP